MAEDRLAQLQAVDPAILTDVVRQDQRRPDFEITDWSARRLSDKGIINPDGLWLVSGDGRDVGGPRPWSVVVKCLQRQDPELPAHDFWYWKREALLAQSGLAADLPGRARAPRFYRVDDTADGAWIWMEHVIDGRAAPWTLDDYAFVARQLGCWNGTYLTSRPLPNEPWLARDHCRTWMAFANPETTWAFALNLKHLSGETRRRCERLWDEREMFLQVLAALPQTWGHFDSQRRNLFLRLGADQADELVFVDWALCGTGAVGGELSNLVGMSCMLFEWDPNAAAALEAAAWAGYVQGLADAGWPGLAGLARLGYTAWVALYIGAVTPALAAWWCSAERRAYALQQFGAAEEALYVRWLPMLAYALELADEARALMQTHGLP